MDRPGMAVISQGGGSVRAFATSRSLYDAGFCIEIYNIDDRRTFRFGNEEFDGTPVWDGERVLLAGNEITAYRIEDVR